MPSIDKVLTAPLVAGHLHHPEDDLYPLAVTSIPVRSPLSVCLHGFAYFGHGAEVDLRRAFVLSPSGRMMLSLSGCCSAAELPQVSCVDTTAWRQAVSIFQVMDVVLDSVVMNVYIQVFVWT